MRTTKGYQVHLGFSTSVRYHNSCGGYRTYMENTMIHEKELIDKSPLFSTGNPDELNISIFTLDIIHMNDGILSIYPPPPQCSHDTSTTCQRDPPEHAICSEHPPMN